MASAKKCDACGKYYDDNKRFETSGRVHGGILGRVNTITVTGCMDKSFDLCDDCLEALLLFLNELRGDAHKPPGDVGEVIRMIRNFASLAGYEVVGRIALRDKETGRELTGGGADGQEHTV